MTLHPIEIAGTVLEVGVAAAALFVLSTYLMAVLFTRGRFGWPGLRYFANESFLVFLTQSILPLGWLFGARIRRGAAERPIVFVHGYTQNRTNFFWLARYLLRRGHGPFFGFDYQSLQPVQKSAQQLAAFVERVLEATSATEVDLVCHSLGGIVARSYVAQFDGQRVVRRVVTLGSPHRGIGHAWLGVGASMRDLHPPSGFIARLWDAGLPPQVAYHSIASSHDNIVFPFAVSSLGERGDDVVVHRMGHFGILFSEEVAVHVHRALAQRLGLTTAGTPTASDPAGTSQTTTALAPTST
jgi:triacylglycerol esterase/lipase EstA (alpha/beta hydrolase family)